MAGTTTTLSTTIRERYDAGFVEAAHRNNELMQHFPAFTPTGGDTSYRWKVNSSGNDSVEIFTEGQGQPDIGNQTYVNAAHAPTYFRGMLQISGHLRDALVSGWFDSIDEEAKLLRKDIVDLITTSFMGSTYGIEVSVDSTTTYAGISRGSAPYFESSETAVSGPLAQTALEDILEVIRDNDKNGKPGLILGPHNQVTNIYRLAGGPAIQNISDADKAPSLLKQFFAGIEVVGLSDWTDTVIAILDMTPGKWQPKEHRSWDVKEMAPSGDSDVFQMSWAGLLANKMPKHDGKLTGVTA